MTKTTMFRDRYEALGWIAQHEEEGWEVHTIAEALGEIFVVMRADDVDTTATSLSLAVQDLAQRHYAPETRHIGQDDYNILMDAARNLRRKVVT